MAFFNGNGGEREEGWVSLSVYTYLKDTALKATMFMEKKKKVHLLWNSTISVVCVCLYASAFHVFALTHSKSFYLHFS